MFGEIKIYLYAILAIVVTAFTTIFKYRGIKIATLEKDVEYHEAKDTAQKFEKQNVEAAAVVEAKDAKDLTTGTYTI